MKDFDEIFEKMDRNIDRGMKTLDRGMIDLDEAMASLDRKLKNIKLNKGNSKTSKTKITVNGIDVTNYKDIEKVLRIKKDMRFKMIFSLFKWVFLLVVMYIAFSFFLYALKTDGSKVAPLNPSTKQEQTTNEFKKL